MKVKLEDYYFSKGFTWTLAIGTIGVSVYLFFWTTLWWIPLILSLGSFITFSTKYDLTIDLDQKVIIDTFQFLWINIRSEETKYGILNKITIDKERHIYTANSKGRTSVTDFNEYIGTLLYDSNKTFEIKRSINYGTFSYDIKDIAEKLNLKVERSF